MSRFLDAIRVNNTIDKSWEEFFKDPYIIKELETIEEKLICNYTPCDSKVLRFATVDLTKIKIIIFGQDPYPQKGRATGRSFEVADIKDWNDSRLGNNSLVNILKLIYKTYRNYEEKDINVIRNDSQFKIKQLNEVFDYWEEQGVLFLNTALTCEIENEGQHLSDWRCFMNRLIKYIIKNNKNIKYFLWGSEIQNVVKNINEFGEIDSTLIYKCSHPTATNVKKGTEFINSNCFKDTMNEINWIDDNSNYEQDEIIKILKDKKIDLADLQSGEEKDDVTIKKEELYAFVDGSYNVKTNIYGIGVVCIFNNEIVLKISGNGTQKIATASRQVCGEISASLLSCNYALMNGYKSLTIVYDYEGIEKWASGEWNAKIPLTKLYQDEIQRYKSLINIDFIWVKAHQKDKSNDLVKYNELADELAKKGCNNI